MHDFTGSKPRQELIVSIAVGKGGRQRTKRYEIRRKIKAYQRPVVLQMDCCQTRKMWKRVWTEMFNGVVAQVPDNWYFGDLIFFCILNTYKSLNLTSGRSRLEFVPSVSELCAKFKWVARRGRGEGGRIKPWRLQCKVFPWVQESESEREQIEAIVSAFQPCKSSHQGREGWGCKRSEVGPVDNLSSGRCSWAPARAVGDCIIETFLRRRGGGQFLMIRWWSIISWPTPRPTPWSTPWPTPWWSIPHDEHHVWEQMSPLLLFEAPSLWPNCWHSCGECFVFLLLLMVIMVIMMIDDDGNDDDDDWRWWQCKNLHWR